MELSPCFSVPYTSFTYTKANILSQCFAYIFLFTPTLIPPPTFSWRQEHLRMPPESRSRTRSYGSPSAESGVGAHGPHDGCRALSSHGFRTSGGKGGSQVEVGQNTTISLTGRWSPGILKVKICWCFSYIVTNGFFLPLLFFFFLYWCRQSLLWCAILFKRFGSVCLKCLKIAR